MKRNSIIKSTILVFTLTIIAKVIGFVKSIIMASCFGADLNSDAYFFSNTIVANVLYMITTSVGISFLPIYVKIRENEGREKSGEFTAQTIVLMSFFSVLLTAIVVMLAPFLIKVFAPTYTGEQFDKTVLYLRVMASGILFALLTNIFSNLLNGERIYGFSNLSAIINSLVLILMILLFSHSIGIMSAVLALPFSYVAQFFALSLKGRKYVSRLSINNLWNVSTRILFNQALPILLSNGTIELNQMIDKMLLVSIEDGAVSAVHYSSVLFQFATNIVCVPIATIVFTELSEYFVTNEFESVRQLIKNTIHTVLIIGIPVTIVMLIYPAPIVDIVFGHGQFSKYAVSQSAIGLFFYGYCLVPTCLKQIMTKAFYSVHDTRIPMALSIMEVILNIGSSVLLSRFMGLAGVVCGTAIATSVFSVVQIVVFSKKKVFLQFKTELIVYLHIFLCTIITGLFGYLFSLILPEKIIGFILLSMIVFVVFYFTLYLMHDKMLNVIISKVRNGFRNKLHR